MRSVCSARPWHGWCGAPWEGASSHLALCKGERETASACELPGGTRLGGATGRWRNERAGVRSRECRCDPGWSQAWPERGAVEEARGPQPFGMRKVEMEVGWGGGSHRLPSVCQALCQWFIHQLLSTCYMPGSVLGARDAGVNKNSVSALLQHIPNLSGSR